MRLSLLLLITGVSCRLCNYSPKSIESVPSVVSRSDSLRISVWSIRRARGKPTQICGNKHGLLEIKVSATETELGRASLQSIYVTRDRVILKFEARVQIYMAVLNIGCKIQNFAGNVVSFSKINSCEISF